MKGIVLAGGLGTRLYPVTRVVNKHILPLYDRPMFFWGVQRLIESGINDIAIVSGPPFGNQIKNLIRFIPKKDSVKIRYINQSKPAGMPDAINKCKNIFKGSDIIVIAGDNYYQDNFRNVVKDFSEGAVSFLRKVPDPQRYGVPVYKDSRLVKIAEKPKKPLTNWVVTGPHIFDSKVFNHISILSPSKRGELEIAELNNIYLKQGKLILIKAKSLWGDTGTFESLLKVSLLVQKNEK